MINKDNLKDLLKYLGFTENKEIYSKSFKDIDASLKVDFAEEELIYPEDKGFTVNERQTCNFKANENFVVFECVHRLFEKGYKAEHIELEQVYSKIKKEDGGGKSDIVIRDNDNKVILIIECKTFGNEFKRHWDKTLQNGDQLFRYLINKRETQFLCLYSSDFIDNQLKRQYNLIILKDNENHLEKLKENKPLSYHEAEKLNKEDIFNVWKETYKQDFATRGLFEEDIPAYHIGKEKFSLNDLQIISNKDIQGKYHEFATILRQHNVSGRENAFDKLVNLFLCKIVDEEQNPDELKFYWKGIAYDSYFDLQDRLQQLYQSGMKLFLGEAVTYIDNAAIDQAFRFFKNDPDATKETIKKYFRQLKFFTNNDFAFIDVHNETLFYQNAVVLLKIVKMLQDIRLKTSEQNQFLGDMFEGFLDQGIKQSEGQFFTPMPIVKFILASLPLEKIIMENEQVPKVIDYACGAGHFLNEYALQIAPYVAKHKDADITEYYPEIAGIEKEYRLSKVAKVSAFMYGQDAIKIIYNDALIKNPGQQDNGFKVKDNEYSVLISNPPYSVKGFLETLDETERKRFELIETIDDKSFANNNSIEAFFIERAKQLLKSDGVAGIIAPSSILSKGSSKQRSKKQNVYVGTREIIIKYFDIIAIAEFGSGTFGKTGTNTVTLFLKRRKENPSSADHYKNRVDEWFKNDMSKDVIFEDEHFIKKYCEHLEYNFDDYKTLLEGSPNENILNTDLFKEYRKDFENSPEIKNLKKQRSFKALSQDEQKAESDKRFLEYLKISEKDKLYYFVLASENPADVVIVKTPAENNAKKRFLGYEWSSAKGNEGIKYLGSEAIITGDIKTDDEADSNLEEDDVRVLSNLLNLNNIQTPLYDPKNPENTEKINSIIKANFNGNPAAIPESLKEYVTTAKLIDMLDFSRKEFNKAISLTPKKTITINTKWELVKLGDVTEVIAGQSPKSTNYNESGKGLPFYQGKKDFGTLYLNNPIIWTTEITKESIKGDLLMSVRAPVGAVNFNPFDKICIGRGLAAIRTGNKDLLKYLFEFVISHQYLFTGYHGATFESISTADLKDIKIPLPPHDVQKQIVQECEAIDKEFEKAVREIEDAKKEIENKVSELFNKGYQTKKIGDICEIYNGGTPKTTIQEYWNGKINWATLVDTKSKYLYETQRKITQKGLDNSNAKLLPVNTVLFSSRATIGDVCIAKIETCTNQGYKNFVCNSDLIEYEYLYYILKNEAKKIGSLGHGMTYPEISKEMISNYTIPVPDIQTQKALVDKIEKQENKIKKAQAIIDSIAERKQEVIKKYL